MNVLLAFKRILTRGAVIVMLASIFASVLLCGLLKGDDGIPNCGVVSGTDENAVLIADLLSDDGLVRYESTEELKKGILRGEVASGIVFPNDFTKRLERLDTDDMLTFYEAPTALFNSLFKFRTVAHIMDVYAPYLVSRLLYFKGADIPYAQMRDIIENYLANNEPFEFTFENAEGAPLVANHYSLNLTAGTLALFLFFAFGLFAVPYTEKQFVSIVRRIGFKKAFFSYALPSFLAINALFFGASAAACALSDAFFGGNTASLISQSAVYCVLLSSLGITVTAVFGSTEKMRVPVMAICLLSVALCPIFVDVGALIGLPSYVLHLLPTMFFYTAGEKLPLCTAIALCAFALSLVLYAARFKKKKFN